MHDRIRVASKGLVLVLSFQSVLVYPRHLWRQELYKGQAAIKRAPAAFQKVNLRGEVDHTSSRSEIIGLTEGRGQLSWLRDVGKLGTCCSNAMSVFLFH
jgi:hypothetical protein